MAKERLYVHVTLVGPPLDESQLTSLLTGFTRNSDQPRDYLHKKIHTIGSNEFDVGFCTTLNINAKVSREVNYAFTRVFVLIFDASKPDSLKALRETYHPEINEPRQHKSAFSTILLGVRTTAENTHEALIAEAHQFAAEKNIDIFMIRSLDNLASIREFVDIATLAGLKKQGKLGIAHQCSEYLEYKKRAEDFVSFCLVMTKAALPPTQLKLILFLVAKNMLGGRYSDDYVKNVISSVIAYAAESKPRIWKSGTRATLFKANPHYTPNKNLLTDPAPTYYKALSLSKVE